MARLPRGRIRATQTRDDDDGWMWHSWPSAARTAELPAGWRRRALAACGATFDGLCLVGVAHHVGVAVAAAVGVRGGRIALGAVAVACAVLAAAPLEQTESSTLAATLAVARLIGEVFRTRAADGLGARVSPRRQGGRRPTPTKQLYR